MSLWAQNWLYMFLLSGFVCNRLSGWDAVWFGSSGLGRLVIATGLYAVYYLDEHVSWSSAAPPICPVRTGLYIHVFLLLTDFCVLVTGGYMMKRMTLSITPIGLKKYRILYKMFLPTATVRERTLAAQHWSWYLNHLISTYLVAHAHPHALYTCILGPGKLEFWPDFGELLVLPSICISYQNI